MSSAYAWRGVLSRIKGVQLRFVMPARRHPVVDVMSAVAELSTHNLRVRVRKAAVADGDKLACKKCSNQQRFLSLRDNLTASPVVNLQITVVRRRSAA